MRITTFLIVAIAATGLAGCNKAKPLPSPLEVIGKSETPLGEALVLRDRGTGCEILAIQGLGMMVRNERSADGNSVKQRCVITGEEQSVTVNGPVTTSQQPSFSASPNPVGSDAQEQAVRDAIREQTQGAIPPAAPAAPAIPPPSGKGQTTAVPREDDSGGVESQLKN